MITGISVKSNQFRAKSMLPEIENKPAEKLSEEYEKIGKSTKKSQGDVSKFDKTLKKNRKELASFDKIEVLKNKFQFFFADFQNFCCAIYTKLCQNSKEFFD